MEITRKVFESQRQRKFGVANPERQSLAFWEWMIRTSEDGRLRDVPHETCRTPNKLRTFFGQEGDYSKGPIWNFARMGATRTPHPDGRLIYIAGEHEDHYDPDFCIYNDVVVIGLDGSIAIYGYPEDVFPPTDFHTATLLDDKVIVIGRLGYMAGRRPGTTPVFALDLNSYRAEAQPSHGETPGWIFEHTAELGPDGILVRGGEIWEGRFGEERIRRNFDDFLFDPATGGWKRLTDRKRRQFSISNKNKMFVNGRPFRGCRGIEGESWKGDALEIPEDKDSCVYISPEALLPRHIEHEVVSSEEFSLEDRIVVAGTPVSIKVAGFSVEIVIEGRMDEVEAVALVRDVKESIEAYTGLTCVLKSYP